MNPLNDATDTPRRYSSRQILVKTVLYRVLGLLVMLIVGYFYTRNLKKTLEIGVVTELFQTMLYYSYEHVWNSAV